MMRCLNRLVLASALILVLPACDPGMETELEKIAFTEAFAGVVRFDSGDRAVVGSRWCPEWSAVELDGAWVDDEALVAEAQACFDLAVSGEGSLDMEGCVLVDGVGDTTLELTVGTCAHGSLQDDRFVLQGVDAAGLEARWWLYPSMVFDPPSRDGSGAGPAYPGLPADYREPSPDEPLVVLADLEQVLFHTLSDEGGIVAWPRDEQSLDGLPAGSEVGPVGVSFTLADAESMTPTLTVPGTDVVFPEVVGRVLPTDATLELHDVGHDDEAIGLGLVRDVDRHILFGVPVEVELPSPSPYLLRVADPAEEALYRGWFSVDDACFEPGDMPIAHDVEVTARVGDLEATRVFSWQTPALSADEVDAWEAPEDCEQVVRYLDSGCACRSDGAGGGLAGGLLIVPLAWRRRRSGVRARACKPRHQGR